MKFAVVISFLVTSGLTAPVENEIERLNTSQVEEGSIPVAVLVVVPDQPAFRDEGDELMELSPESALPLPVSEERAAKTYPYEDPYVNAAAVYKPVKPASESGGVVATFTANVSPSAIPILLSCAPKIVTGKLAEPKPSAYRSVFSDLSDILTQDSPVNDFNLSDILGLGSPTSVISSEGEDERKRRNSWIENGVTRYKVSENFPEMRLGNHHLVSEDYPLPNMVKLTPNHI